MHYKELLVENRTLSPYILDYSYLTWFYSTKVLPFNMEAQTQTQWCWAATSKSVSHFYSIASPWTQCKIASGELSLTCCTNPVPGPCNQPWYLDRAFKRTNNFVSMQGGTISYSRIKQELDKGLVVGTRIGWSGGGGHFMVIHGVSTIAGTQYLHIDDPIYGKSTLTYNQFATNYQGSGTWTHTYFTKKYFYFMWFKDLVFNPILLNPIPQVRPVLHQYDELVKIDDFKDHDLRVPHHIYDLGLNDIGKETVIPKAATALRLLDFKKDTPVGFYDVALDPEKPELLQMNASKPYFDLLNRSMERLKAADAKTKTQGELRLIRVPALNLEAMWLNYPGRAKDVVTLIPRFDYEYIKCDTEYTLDEFKGLLYQEKRKLGKLDDQIGG